MPIVFRNVSRIKLLCHYQLPPPSSPPMPPKSSKKKVKVVALVKTAKAAHNAKSALKRISGHGDYRPTAFRRVKGKGDYLGDLFGGLASKAGSWLGNTVQGGFRKLTGFGDYRQKGPTSNSLYQHPKRNSESASSTGPNEESFSMGACSVKFAGKAPRVQHREYIGPVLSTGAAFNTKIYRIQPGLSGVGVLFPWGSSVAGCFQQYEMHGCIFEFVSTSSDFATGSALGSVMLSTVYDAEAPPLSSVIEVDNHEYTTTAKPSTSFYHPIECASKDNPTTIRYVRKANSAASGADERLDDVGIFQLSTNGLSAPVDTQIGELWVTYDISFLKAALPDTHVGTAAQARYTSIAANTAPSGTVTYNPYNSLPISMVGESLKLKVFLPVSYNGNYLLTFTAYPTGTAFTAPGLAFDAGSDITLLNLFQNGAGTFVSNVLASSATSVSYTIAFSTIASAAAKNYLMINGASGSWQIANCTVIVTALDNDIADPKSELSRLAARGDVDALFELLQLRSRERGAATPPPSEPSSSAFPPAGILPRRLSSCSYEEEKFLEQADTPRPGEPATDMEQSVYLPKGVLADMLAKARGS